MAYTWTAFYRDGGLRRQARGDRLDLGPDLAGLQLTDHEGRRLVEQSLEPGQRALYAVLPHTPLSGRPCHVLGWERPLARGGRTETVRHLCYASEDGRIVMAGRVDTALPWFAAQRPADPRIPDLSWVAVYEDGRTDPMVEPRTGHEISTELLDRSRLLSLVFYGTGGLPWFEQYLDRGRRLIYRRRTYESPRCGLMAVLNLVGWRREGDGDGAQHVAYAVNDSRIVMAGAFRAGHPWFHGIEPVPADAWEVGSPPPGDASPALR